MTEQVQVALDVVNVEAENFKTIQSHSVRGAQRAMTTKVKVTFADSSVGYVEIHHGYSNLHFAGTSEVETVAIYADQTVIDSPYYVLPSVKVYRGVAQVELNASIASVEIQSTQPVTVKGKGNFDKVTVHTDHAVHLASEGTIETIETTSKNIELGQDVKVGETQINGVVTDPEDVIINYDDVEGNIGDIQDEDKQDNFIAKAVPVKDRYGYVTLETTNTKGGTIKYHQVSEKRNVQPVKPGQRAPKDAIVYHQHDQVIDWFSHEIHVYEVNDQDEVLHSFVLNRINKGYTNPFISVQLEKDNFYIVSSYTEELNLDFLFISNADEFYYFSLNELEKTKVDGVSAFVVPLDSTFSDQPVFFTLSAWNHQEGGFLTYWPDIGEEPSFAALNTLKHLVIERDNLPDHHSTINSYYRALQYSFWHIGGENAYEDYYKFVWDEIINVWKSYSFDTTSKEQTVRDLKILHDEVANRLSPQVEQFQKVTDQINALYKENRWDYPWGEQLVDGITMQQLQAVQHAVEQLPQNQDRLELEGAIHSAIQQYETSKGVQRATTAKAEKSTANFQYRLTELDPFTSTIHYQDFDTQ